jgi:hypothetical protein
VEAEEDGDDASIAEVVVVEAGVFGESFGACNKSRERSARCAVGRGGKKWGGGTHELSMTRAPRWTSRREKRWREPVRQN